jgi:hypothetical protein
MKPQPISEHDVFAILEDMAKSATTARDQLQQEELKKTLGEKVSTAVNQLAVNHLQLIELVKSLAGEPQEPRSQGRSHLTVIAGGQSKQDMAEEIEDLVKAAQAAGDEPMMKSLIDTGTKLDLGYLPDQRVMKRARKLYS